jgi:iron complex transport system substrate-binding protein
VSRLCTALVLVGLVGCGDEATVTPEQDAPAEAAPLRVVTLAPALSEVVLALEGPELVGFETSSRELAPDLPVVGPARQVSAEGVLSLGPDLVLINDRTGPPEVLEQIASAGVEVVEIPHERTVEGVSTLVERVAEAVKADATPLRTAFTESCRDLGDADGPPTKALFIYARGAGAMQVAGTGTAAEAMLTLGGLENAVTGYEGYKPLTPEAALKADPDWVVFTTRGLEASGGIDGLAGVPGLGQLEAVIEGRIAAVEDFALLAWGLEACEGAKSLRSQVGR